MFATRPASPIHVATAARATASPQAGPKSSIIDSYFSGAGPTIPVRPHTTRAWRPVELWTSAGRSARRDPTRGDLPVAIDTLTHPDDTKSWPDLAIGLYDRLTGRAAEITYEFEDFELMIPSSASADATHARWRMSGVLKIRTRDTAGG